MKLASALALALLATTATLGASGCAQPTSEDTGVAAQGLGQGVNVPNPSGAYFASITATGSGCPAGSWEAGISDDGQAFTVTFSGYEARVAPGATSEVRDCSLAIDLKTPSGYSFSVSSFHYQGYALLDQPGMTAEQTAKYYFRGNPVPGTEQRSDISGPYDGSYLHTDEIGLSHRVWSPCGATRTLNAQTRLVLRNNASRRGSGYVNTTSIDGQVESTFVFGLDWRTCNANPPPPPPPDGECGTLASGQELGLGNGISSCDGRYRLEMQGDGNLVLYKSGDRPLWATNTDGSTGDGAAMQGDGNFVVYAGGQPIWASDTSGQPGSKLSVQNDGNLVVYAPDGRAIWASNTAGQ